MPAELNPWYLLMNWYGNGEENSHIIKLNNLELRSSNRIFWHCLVFHYLGSKMKDYLITNNIHRIEDLKPFTDNELILIEDKLNRFLFDSGKREYFNLTNKISKENTKYISMECSEVCFDHVSITNYIIPFAINFSMSSFNHLDVENTVFMDQTTFSSVYFFKGANFKNALFNHKTYFSDSCFLCNVFFDKAKFLKRACFKTTIFHSKASFENVTFEDFSEFRNAIFKENSYFTDAVFLKSSNFNGLGSKVEATFEGIADFRNAKFKSTTDFKERIFCYPPLFHGSELHVDTIWDDVVWPQKPKNIGSAKEAERAWSTLKLLMNKVMRHDAELMFFAKELEAKNAYKGKSLSYRFYKATSNLGQSISRPFWWLFGTFIFFCLIYYLIGYLSIEPYNHDPKLLGILGQSALLSFVNSFPFVGIQRYVYQEASNLVYFIGAVQTILSTVFLFLIGLGIRNKYRIK